MAVEGNTSLQQVTLINHNINALESELPNNQIKREEIHVKNGKSKGLFNFQTQVMWPNVIVFTIFHVLSVYYFLTFPYSQHLGLIFWIYASFYINGIGILIGVHRYWSHRSFKATLPLRILLAICFYSSGQNKIRSWVRDHRTHHKHTDTDGDPHNIRRGFFFAHFGWQMMKKCPQVIKSGRALDISDVTNDPVVAFFDRNFIFFKIFCCFFLPVVIPVYFFDQNLKATIITQWFMRYPISLHVTFAVNSFAHIYGDHTYHKSLSATENRIISWIAGGEGWHNYHHVFPWDYKAAEFPSFFFNQATTCIHFFHKIGWAYDLKQAKPEMVKRVVERQGDGTHLFYTGRTLNDHETARDEHLCY